MPEDTPGQEDNKFVPAPTLNDMRAPAYDSAAPQPLVETEPVTRPVDTPAMQPNMPDPTPGLSPTKKSKKKWAVALVVATVLTLLTAGGALAYNLWYQNPEKVLGDAIGNVFSAATYKTNGKFTFTPKSSLASPYSRVTLDFDGMADKTKGMIDGTLTVEASSKQYSLSGSGLLADNGDLYVKVKGLKELLGMYLSGNAPGMSSMFDGVITKIDDKWVKIEASKLKEFSEEASEKQKCINKIKDAIKKDNSLLNGVLDAYNNHKFVVVKENLGTKDGSLGYRIEADNDKAKAFVTDVKKTELYKQYVACDPSAEKSFAPDSKDMNSDGESKLEVWIDQWSHQFTKLKLTGSDSTGDGSIEVDTKFNQPVNISIPSTSMSLDQLKIEIQKAQQAYLQQLYSSRYSTNAYDIAHTSNSI